MRLEEPSGGTSFARPMVVQHESNLSQEGKTKK